MNALPAVQRLWVGYGSESGNARALAERLGSAPELGHHQPQVLPINDIDPAALGQGDVLLAISSSFGDGEPPANAGRFLEALQQAGSLQGLRYSIFGLGDTGYPRFCGFTRELDTLLAQREAQPLLQRVDADAGFEGFFRQWLPVLGQVLDGDTAAGNDLCLQVTAYGEDNSFAAPVISRQRLSVNDPAAWSVRLDLAGSGIVYRAGDTLHVVPGNDPTLLHLIADWYGDPAAATLLADRELRLIGKPVLRELAKLTASGALKDLLKVSQRQALEAYLHGLDVLDLLQDHATPDTLPLQSLVDLLPRCLPRAYSIASHPGEDGSVELCVREVRYTLRGRERRGTASGWLLHGNGSVHDTMDGAVDGVVDESVRVYCRSNPACHLPDDPEAPVVLIGTGTGIAPLVGLLCEMQATGQRREACLVFGDRHRASDFLYEEQLTCWQDSGMLGTLATAFSRDGQSKYYVQHAIADHATQIRSLLAQGAHVYVCGNRQHLEASVREAINQLLPVPDAGDGWALLQEQGRLHRELY